MASSKRVGRIRGVAEEVVVISPERKDRSYAAQLAACVHIIALGDDLTRLVFGLLSFPSRIASSHVCAYWRALAVNDPLLWTVLDGDPALIPILWARAGSGTAIDVRLDFGESCFEPEDVASCISKNAHRMTGIRLVVPDPKDLTSAAWTTILDALSRSGPQMRRLHLDIPYFPGEDLIPPFSFAPLGPSCRLRELALLNMDGLDLTVLPATLTSFAYGDPLCLGEINLTFPELEIILRTCPALKSLWLSVFMDLSPGGEDIDIPPHPQLQLEELTLGWTDATITRHLLHSLSVRNMRYVDVGDCVTDPVHGVLRDFEGHTMSILHPTSIINGGDRPNSCNLRVSDSSGRFRSVREVNFKLLRQYETLWSHLVSLTIFNIWIKWGRPPDMPCLESLRILYEPRDRDGVSEYIGTLKPWGRRTYRRGGWQCPCLHTLEIAPAVRCDDSYPPWYPSIIAIQPRHILAFVTRELPSAPVSRVIIKGDGIRLESDADEELPFSLSYDPSDRRIEVVDYESLPFNGFDSTPGMARYAIWSSDELSG